MPPVFGSGGSVVAALAGESGAGGGDPNEGSSRGGMSVGGSRSEVTEGGDAGDAGNAGAVRAEGGAADNAGGAMGSAGSDAGGDAGDAGYRLPPFSGKPEPLATWADSPGHWIGFNLKSSGGELFWHDIVDVRRIPAIGGELAIVHHNTCGPMYGFDVDESEVFLGTCSGDGAKAQTVSAFARDTGDERILSDSSALSVAKVGEALYIARCDGGAVLRPTDSEPVALDTSAGCFWRVAARGTRVYFEGSTGVRTLETATLAWRDLSEGYLLAADETYAVTTEDLGELTLVDARDGNSLPLTRPDEPGEFGGAAIEDGVIYYTFNGESDSHVGRVTKDGTIEALARRGATLGSIEIDERAIYWEEATDQPETTLWRLEK